MDLALMFITQKNIAGVRKLTKNEWLLLECLEDKFMQLVNFTELKQSDSSNDGLNNS